MALVKATNGLLLNFLGCFIWNNTSCKIHVEQKIPFLKLLLTFGGVQDFLGEVKFAWLGNGLKVWCSLWTIPLSADLNFDQASFWKQVQGTHLDKSYWRPLFQNKRWFICGTEQRDCHKGTPLLRMFVNAGSVDEVWHRLDTSKDESRSRKELNHCDSLVPFGCKKVL